MHLRRYTSPMSAGAGLATDWERLAGRHSSKIERNRVIWLLVILLIPLLVAYWWCMGGSSSHSMSAPVVVNATAKHTASIIFLHGLGDTGHGWAQAFTAIRQPHIRCVCPTANIIPVSLNMGMKMPSWFDIKGLDPNSDEDEAGIKAAAEQLQTMISEEEKLGIPRDRIVVGGFSQGGAVALYSSLSFAKPPVGGIIALSSWLPLHKNFPAALKANQETPMFQGHGNADPLVQYTFGELTSKLIKSFNSKHTFKSYETMGHSSCDEEMNDVKNFLKEVIPPI